jgi:hypothetical protein
MGKASERDASLAARLAAFWVWDYAAAMPVELGPAYAPHLMTVDGVLLSTQTLRAWIARDWLWAVTEREAGRYESHRPQTIGLTEVGREMAEAHKDA